MNFLLFSAMGGGQESSDRGASAAAGLWAQTWDRLSVNNHIPLSPGIWSEDALYGKGKRRFPSGVRLCPELCGSDQSQQNQRSVASTPVLTCTGVSPQPHQSQPRRSLDRVEEWPQGKGLM